MMMIWSKLSDDFLAKKMNSIIAHVGSGTLDYDWVDVPNNNVTDFPNIGAIVFVRTPMPQQDDTSNATVKS